MKLEDFQKIAKETRVNIVSTIGTLGTGHIGGSLSIVEVLVSLYYKQMNIDPSNPKMEGRDRLIVSKGHAGPAVYSVLAQKGYFDKEMLKTLNISDTNLPSHCDMNKTPGVDMTTGSLGQGFSAAVGIAYGSKISEDGAKIYSIIGDGESQEGQIWEAAMFAAHNKLNNFIAFTDYNRCQIDGTTDDVNGLEPLDKKWEAFGFRVFVVDGHDFEEINNAIDSAKAETEKPSMIILNTLKGKGVKYIEDAGFGNHSMGMTKEQMLSAIEEING